ncbi:MAG: RHS repeat domain-containing protein [Bacteroidota bacterium]
MKHFFTLTLVSVWVLSAFCQLPNKSPYTFTSFWELPEFVPTFIASKNIQSIEIDSYRAENQAPKDHLARTTFLFNKQGKVLERIDTEREDTSMVQRFDYNRDGLLVWERTEDKVWNREYKEGYRFNRNKKLFQVKSYEAINASDLMLLNTKQYVYDKDSNLVAIRFMQNEQLIKVQNYQYDTEGRLTMESIENHLGETTQATEYTYNQQDQLVSVVNRKGKISEFRYDYNSDGNPIRAEWVQGEVTRGIVTYTYNGEGLLTRVSRVMNEPGQSETSSIQVFEYKPHQKEVEGDVIALDR